ncbi:MAG: plasmid pRiA4b ORF-3 family protein [Thermovenabulum sp.]
MEGAANIMKILQMKITLKDIKPPVWRRILVKDDITFYKLNTIIQYVMGWSGYHLYEFRIGDMVIGEKDDGWDLYDDYEFKNAKRFKLSNMNFEPKDKFLYIYDFGDNWEHSILVEKVLEPQEGIRYPLCIAGKRNCPPEDVGGPWGYQNFLEAIKNPRHPEHKLMLQWIGGSFDPEEFNIDKINQILKTVR